MLGSCTVYLHIRNKTFEVLCQVTNTDDCFLMGRVLAKAMGYISYPEILPPIKMTSIKTAQAETNMPGREFCIFALEDTDKMQGKPEM